VKFDNAGEPRFPFFPLSPFPFSSDPPDVFLVLILAEKQAERREAEAHRRSAVSSHLPLPRLDAIEQDDDVIAFA
jgi:hypothetical protein